MAYLWTDKVKDFYYSNPESDTVAVLWTDPDDKLTREHYIKVDEEDEQWRDFVAEFPYEEINRRSDVRNENFREEFREAFRNYAQRKDVNFNDANPTNKFEDTIIDFLSGFDNTNAEHKETLFKLKLKVFEQEYVKNAKSSDQFKNAKTFIRKADNPLDVLLGYMVFTSEAELKMAPTEKFEVLGVYVPIK
jgi:23S rRNA maturation mini-RNase III